MGGRAAGSKAGLVDIGESCDILSERRRGRNELEEVGFDGDRRDETEEEEDDIGVSLARAALRESSSGRQGEVTTSEKGDVGN